MPLVRDRDGRRLHIKSRLMGESLVSKEFLTSIDTQPQVRLFPDVNVLKIGGQSICDRGVKALPAIIREIVEEISTLNREGKGRESLHRLLMASACRAAVRGHSKLRREEIDKLVEHLKPFTLSATCPHGRPIFFFFSRDDLSKQFKRNR